MDNVIPSLLKEVKGLYEAINPDYKEIIHLIRRNITFFNFCNDLINETDSVIEAAKIFPVEFQPPYRYFTIFYRSIKTRGLRYQLHFSDNLDIGLDPRKKMPEPEIIEIYFKCSLLENGYGSIVDKLTSSESEEFEACIMDTLLKNMQRLYEKTKDVYEAQQSHLIDTIFTPDFPRNLN